MGQFVQTVYVKSDSNPSVSNLSEGELQALQNNYQMQFGNRARSHLRRASEGEMLAHRVQVLHSDEDYENNPYPSDSGNMTNDWVAGLPQEYSRRARSHTEPMMPPENILMDSTHFPPLTASRAATLPATVSLVPPGQSGNTADASSEARSRRSSQPQLGPDEVTSPMQLSPTHTVPSRKASIQSSAMASPTSEQKPESSMHSPTTPMTPSSKLVKIYMSRVQKGMSSQEIFALLCFARFFS